VAALDLPSSRGAREPVSPDGLWTALDTPPTTVPTRVPGVAPARRFGAVFALNQGMLREILQLRGLGARHPGAATPGVMTVPLPNGRFTRIRVEEAPILSPELARSYPSIRTFRGQGIDDPTLSARLDQTRWGFHAQLLTAKGSFYIDPVDPARPREYRSYWKSELVRAPFRCGVEGGAFDEWASMALVVTNPSGDHLRTYRLAVTATGEYTTFFAATDCPGGSPATCPHDAAVARITTTMNRVTGIYEREVAERFTLTAFNIYEDPATDPFPTGATVDGNLLNENQTDLDAKVGSANYDLGHIVSQGGGGGLAGVGVACNGSNKARGGTSLGNPTGDGFDVDYVAHEMGHQMGGQHTFNGNTGSCGGGNRSAGDAYEPGSGTTIMAYAGICGVQDVQPHSDDYFHVHSFDQIIAYREGGGACGTQTATGNGAPSVDAGLDYTIPQSTPFTLTAAGASDPNGDPVTYNWEEFDLGAAGVPAPTNTDGPLFRSRPGTSSPSRTLPRCPDLVSGVATPWEVLPGVNRDLNFRVTVRDNRAGGGGVDYDSMVVHVDGAPFKITSPVSGGALECGAPGSIAWDKGGSTAANVNALLSTTDGCGGFSTLIASTPNDGSESFTVPTTLTSTAWLRLEPTDNIYFSLSGPLTIHDTLAPVVTAPPPLPAVECTSSSPQGASPSLGTPSSTDLCDGSVPVTNDAPGIFPLGTTTVTWSGTDKSGNTGTATQSVTVVDTTPPTLVAPPAVVAECTSPLGTPVALGTPTVSDICWATLTVTNNAPPLFPLGTTTVTWKATDGSSNSSTATQAVKVQDTTPPSLQVTVTPAVLWPPNHKMVPIHAQISVVDACDGAPTVKLVSITSNEPDNGLGDGDTANDIQGAAFGTDDRDFLLRAERSGKGTGRIYSIVYEAKDGSGNTTLQTVTVKVPHNQ
jgi:hypothetical protein